MSRLIHDDAARASSQKQQEKGPDSNFIRQVTDMGNWIRPFFSIWYSGTFSNSTGTGSCSMSYVDWMIRTKQLGTCSCDYGCPCEFNAPPTRLPCEGVMAMEITEGYFSDIRLDGLRVAGVYHWPGPVHECNGTWWSIIDKSASEPPIPCSRTAPPASMPRSASSCPEYCALDRN